MADSSAFRRYESAFYAFLCLAMIGGLVWLWRVNHQVPASRKSVSPPSVSIVKQTSPVAVVPTPPPVMPSGSRPAETALEAQIALTRRGICPGSIDGVIGSQTKTALALFQKQHGLPLTGLLDPATKAVLVFEPPATTEYTVTKEDLGRLMTIPKTWLGKSKQTRLDFQTILELLGEKSFSNPQLIRSLNPNVNWNAVTNGMTVLLPRVEYPSIDTKAAFAKISLAGRALEVFDAQSNLLVHFPCSIGRIAAKRPEGDLHITTIATDPNYTFDPEVFAESPEAQAIGHKLIIPPGPNNPVGVVWIGLDRPGYGIHGTPAPEQIGRTESHGCFRLANWNAAYLAKLVWVGMTVIVE